MTEGTGPALLVVMIDIAPEFEEDFNRWYNEEHLPERVGLPGFRSARRFVSYEGGPKYLALYDLDDVDALQTTEYLALVSPPSEWTLRVESRFSSRLRAVYTDITPPETVQGFADAGDKSSSAEK